MNKKENVKKLKVLMVIIVNFDCNRQKIVGICVEIVIDRITLQNNTLVLCYNSWDSQIKL